jgi:hypothetical protein
MAHVETKATGILEVLLGGECRQNKIFASESRKNKTKSSYHYEYEQTSSLSFGGQADQLSL